MDILAIITVSAIREIFRKRKMTIHCMKTHRFILEAVADYTSNVLIVLAILINSITVAPPVP